jgi:hypothetical protein
MQMSRQIKMTIVTLLLSALFLSSCRSRQDGAIEGAVLPPETSAHIECFLKCFMIVSERENGKVEVIQELPFFLPCGADQLHNRMVLNRLLLL